MTTPIRSIALVSLFALAGDEVAAQVADAQLEALKRSQFCTRAADEFMARPEWSPKNQVALSQTFTSHYNTRLSRCLVQVQRVQFGDSPKETVEMLHVYDSLSGKALGGKVLTRSAAPDEPVIRSVVLVRDGKFIRDRAEAAVTIQWFDQLMVE